MSKGAFAPVHVALLHLAEWSNTSSDVPKAGDLWMECTFCSDQEPQMLDLVAREQPESCYAPSQACLACSAA